MLNGITIKINNNSNFLNKLVKLEVKENQTNYKWKRREHIILHRIWKPSVPFDFFLSTF
jgi:hypothetical protein